MPEEQPPFRPEVTPQPPGNQPQSNSADDTSPSRQLEPSHLESLSLEDTSPSGIFRPQVLAPAAKEHKPGQSGRYLLGAIILAVCATLIVSLALLIDQLGEPPSDDTAVLTVNLQVDGETRLVRTRALVVNDLLQDEGVELAPADQVMPSRGTPLETDMRIVVERARDVMVTDGDDVMIVTTTFDQPFDVLRAANIRVNPSDIVSIDGQVVGAADLIAWPLPVQSIEIVRAQPIRIIDGENALDFNTTAQTVGDALFEADVQLFLADTVEPSLNALVMPELVITIDRSRPVTFIVDGERIETRVTARAVGPALIEAGVALNGLDYTIPGEAVDVLPGMSVRIIRVTEEIVTEDETIPFETVYQADASAPLDTRTVLQAGQNGLYQRTVRVRYENGVEISRGVESEGLVQSPVNQVLGYGTNIVINTLQTPEGTVQYWRRLRMYATSYHPAALGGDDITATGERLVTGIVAIDPRIISYGTNVFVEGYGTGRAADTGGPRSTPYWIDLGYSDEDWIGWSRWVTVYVLLPVPSDVDYLLPENVRGGPLP